MTTREQERLSRKIAMATKMLGYSEINFRYDPPKERFALGVSMTWPDGKATAFWFTPNISMAEVVHAFSYWRADNLD